MKRPTLCSGAVALGESDGSCHTASVGKPERLGQRPIEWISGEWEGRGVTTTLPHCVHWYTNLTTDKNLKSVKMIYSILQFTSLISICPSI